jgi:hypothetical protein
MYQLRQELPHRLALPRHGGEGVEDGGMQLHVVGSRRAISPPRVSTMAPRSFNTMQFEGIPAA